MCHIKIHITDWHSRSSCHWTITLWAEGMFWVLPWACMSVNVCVLCCTHANTCLSFACICLFFSTLYGCFAHSSPSGHKMWTIRFSLHLWRGSHKPCFPFLLQYVSLLSYLPTFPLFCIFIFCFFQCFVMVSFHSPLPSPFKMYPVRLLLCG